MKEVSILVKINNKDLPYEYNGTGIINKDIIEYKDQEYNYIFDKGISRLTKYNKDTRLIIDFNKEEIVIVQEKTLTIKIKVKEKEIKENYIYFKYIIDNDDIDFSIEIKEVK